MALLACMALGACNPGSGLRALPPAANDAYRVGIDEQVRVITFGQEALTGQFRVNDRGNIDIPLLGSLPASGKTTAELAQSIEAKLKEKQVLLDPSVSVEVVNYRPVFVLGEVAKPGQYSYQPNMTVLTAVAIAGGFTYRAQREYAAILRKDHGESAEGKVGRNTTVEPGDVIDVLERYF